MFGREKNQFEGMTKSELKERLHMIDYEIASTKNKRQLKKFYIEIESINKQLRKIREEEHNQMKRGR